MRFFVWLTMMFCAAGCATPVAEEQPVISEPEESPIEISEIDLAAQDTTFLNAVNGLGGASALHTFTVITDTNGIAWQGIAFGGEAEGLMLEPMQGGGTTAVRIDGALDAMSSLMNVTALSQIDVQQSATAPDVAVTFVRATLSGDSWTFAVSVDHPDTGWEDYTDGWHVETPAGEILTTRILIHPHVGERPFTRSSSGFTIPDDVTEVHVRTHDLISGYGMETLAIPITEAGSGELYEVIR